MSGQIQADLGTVDGISFNSYPMSEQGFNEYVINRATFARHFSVPLQYISNKVGFSPITPTK